MKKMAGYLYTSQGFLHAALDSALIIFSTNYTVIYTSHILKAFIRNFIHPCKFGKFSANMTKLSSNMASVWNCRLKHYGNSAGLLVSEIDTLFRKIDILVSFK